MASWDKAIAIISVNPCHEKTQKTVSPLIYVTFPTDVVITPVTHSTDISTGVPTPDRVIIVSTTVLLVPLFT